MMSDSAPRAEEHRSPRAGLVKDCVTVALMGGVLNDKPEKRPPRRAGEQNRRDQDEIDDIVFAGEHLVLSLEINKTVSLLQVLQEYQKNRFCNTQIY